MKNLQKGFANIILIILVVILAGSVGYLTLVKKQNSNTSQTEQSPSTQVVPTTSSTQTTNTSPTRPLTLPPPETNNTNNQNPTWNTYRFGNTKYTFEVGYPAQWKVANKTETGVNFTDSSGKKQISVFIYTYDPLNSIKDVNQITNTTSSDFRGMKATKLTGESGVTGGQANWLIFQAGSNLYGVVSAPLELFDQVVKSLDI